ncbi:MAG TPA: tail fiber domain-containing protein [Gemmatimonadaceae bacterium]|nr:tail fiber domain-containing protein [Gemmatimonadaceae bacterium]
MTPPHLLWHVLDAQRDLVDGVGEVVPTTAPGLTAGVGSRYTLVDPAAGTATLYLKTGPNATDWTVTAVGALTQALGDARYLQLDGSTPMTGELTAIGAAIEKGGNPEADLLFTVGGVPRWVLRVSDTETGVDEVGSNLHIIRRHNSGSSIGDALSINRATGLVRVGLADVSTGDDLLAVNGRITTGGSVGSLQFADRVNGTAHRWQWYATGNVARLWAGGVSADRVTIDESGNLTATGDVAAFSDRRLKRRIRTRTGGLARVMALRPATYERTDIGGTHAGFIAQEVQSVIPEAVHTQPDERGTLTLTPMPILADVVAAVQDLARENAALRARVAALEAQQAAA